MAVALSAVLAACLIWWFSTGAILIAVRLSERGGPRSRVRASVVSVPLALIGGWCVVGSLNHQTVQGAYLGFAGALALWGWVELTFLTGVLTGPVKDACPRGLSGIQRFWRAWGTIAHHEIALTLMFVALFEVSRGAPNTVGIWAFGLLYLARVSAKLNLFLGVAHVNTEFLPRHLSHLASHFGTAQLNWLFPVSVSALTIVLGYLIAGLSAADTAASATGLALLATLTALALLEHWFLVLPLPDAKLWRWMLPNPAPKPGMDTRERTFEI